MIDHSTAMEEMERRKRRGCLGARLDFSSALVACLEIQELH